MERLTHASLFSGIGGAELAASWMGWENLFHCEINPFGLQVLRYWFPESKEYNDITKTDFTEWRGRVDVLSGGFPCQPFSVAGQRKGADDERYLWPQMCRVIEEVQPRYVVGENVAGITTMVEPVAESKVGELPNLFGEADDIYQKRERYTLDRVCGDLKARGYAVQPVIIPALAVGAPHRRDRVWVLAKLAADACGDEQQGRLLEEEAAHAAPEPGEPHARRIPRPDFKDFPSQPPLCGGDDGFSIGLADPPLFEGRKSKWVVESLKALGNAWCPQVAYEIFRAIGEDRANLT